MSRNYSGGICSVTIFSRFEDRRITKIGKLIATLSGRHLCEIVCHTCYFVSYYFGTGNSLVHARFFVLISIYVYSPQTHVQRTRLKLRRLGATFNVRVNFVHELKREKSSTRGQSYRVQDAWEKRL